MASEEEVGGFLASPLVRWLDSLLPSMGELSWTTLAQGVVLASTLESLDSHISVTVEVEPSDLAARANNLAVVLASLNTFYEDSLGQLVMLAPASPRTLALIPPSNQALNQMEDLLLLLLGAAVQSEQKQDIVIGIKNLPLDTQHGIVDRIRAVTEDPAIVWNKALNDPGSLGEHQRDDLYTVLVEHTNRLVRERSELAKEVVALQAASGNNGKEGGEGGKLTAASSNAMVEVAEYKAKLRKLRQQVEEKTEQLSETREELEKVQAVSSRLKTENLELCQDARAAKTYRDELDVLRERAEKVDKLEAELLRYKDKMNDIEFFKSRVEELREDNRILVETKEMLEEQLAGSRKRCEAVLGLENDLIRVQGDLERLQHEREVDRNKIKDLQEENTALGLSQKNSLSASQTLQAEMEAMKGSVTSKDLNLLSEQLGKDAVTRVHRLELENQRLQRELEAAKTQCLKTEKNSAYEMEVETRRVTLEVSRLEEQGRRDQERLVVVEKEAVEARRGKEELETVVETLRQQNRDLQIEKDTEVESLAKQVSSLNARAAHTANNQLTLLQDENKRMVAERTVLQTQASKAAHEKERLEGSLKIMKEKVEVLESAEVQRENLERENSTLKSNLEELQGLQENYDQLQEKEKAANEQVVSLSQRLDQSTAKLEESQAETAKIRSEHNKLIRKTEAIKQENQSIAALEQERDNLRQSSAQMRATIDSLQKAQQKHEELETRAQTSHNETLKLSRQLESLQRRHAEVEKENSEVEAENRNLIKSVENLKIQARRVNELESENLELEGRAHKVERENKSLVREAERLKQTLDVKDLNLDDAALKLASMERSMEKVKREAETQGAQENRVAKLEAELHELNSASMVDKRALIDLREELVKEKMAGEAAVGRLEAVTSRLAAAGIREGEDGALQGLDHVQKLKEEMTKVTNFAAEISKETGSREERVSSLQAERDQLSTELARLKVAAVGREDREAAFGQQLNTLQEELTELSKERACLQVENRTLQSQSSSLLAQISSLQSENSKLEVEARRGKEGEKAVKEELSQLLADQARLQRLHDQLQADYEELTREREELKASERNLRVEMSRLQEREGTVSQGQDDLLRAKEAIDQERETLKMDKKTLANLRSEHSRLKDDFRSLFTANERMKTEYCNLQTDYKSLKTENNQLKLRHTELQGKLGDAREQCTALDVENTKVTNRCEVLHQLNLSLEEDRKSLMSQVSLLLSQYHDLLTQTLDDKEHYHEEEREYSDKVHNLRRQKEKLEEKIMEQYKRMENSATPKKKGIGSTLVRKMRKAGSNMFLASPSGRGRSRQQGEDHDSSSLGSGGNDSLDSGGRSPADTMLGSESHVEVDNRTGEKLIFRRSGMALPPVLGQDTDSDAGNVADSDSLASFLSGHMQDNELEAVPSEWGLDMDTVSQFSQGPLTTPGQSRKSIGDKQPRSISRVYLSSEEPVGGGGRGWRKGEGEEPRLTSWRRTTTEESPSTSASFQIRRESSGLTPDNSGLPPLPARRPSAVGDSGGVPHRPPKPSRSQNNSDEEGRKDKDSINSDSSIWYEYGCV